MQPVSPFPDAVMQQILNNSVHAFSHTLVMDAIDVSLALDRHLLVYGIEGVFQIETDSASWRLPPSRAGWLPAGQMAKTTTLKPVRCISIFFKHDFIPDAPARAISLMQRCSSRKCSNIPYAGMRHMPAIVHYPIAFL